MRRSGVQLPEAALIESCCYYCGSRPSMTYSSVLEGCWFAPRAAPEGPTPRCEGLFVAVHRRPQVLGAGEVPVVAQGGVGAGVAEDALDAQAPAGDYALISLALDHINDVNDTFGHAAGDAVLTRVAGVLTGSVPDGDAVFRLDGEEFLIVLPGAGQEAASAIAERILTTVRDVDFTGVAPDGCLTVSAGITSVVNAAPAEFVVVLEEADRALYESKAAGRDTITVRQVPV